MAVLTPIPAAPVDAPAQAAAPSASGPSCSIQRSGSLWQLGIEAQELTSAIGLLTEQLQADDDDSRAQAIAELEATLLAEEHNRSALAAKAAATCWVIEHLRGQAAYRQQQARRLNELARSDTSRADALEESLIFVLTRLQPAATRFSFPHHITATAMTVAAPSANGTSHPAASRPIQRPPTALELIRSAERPEAEATTPPTSDSAPPVPQAQPPQLPGFSPEQLAALAAPLDRAKVRQREQGRSKVHYLEGWQVIVEANRIFGFDGWQRQTLAVRCVNQAERLIGREQRPGWGVTYTARVRVTVTAGGRPPLIREGSGAGHGIDVDLGQAHESAIKEARPTPCSRRPAKR